MRIDHELTTLILCALYLLDVSPGSIVLHCLWHYKASKGQGCWLFSFLRGLLDRVSFGNDATTVGDLNERRRRPLASHPIAALELAVVVNGNFAPERHEGTLFSSGWGAPLIMPCHRTSHSLGAGVA